MTNIVLILSLLLFAGCATTSGTRNLSQETIERSVIKGKTTKAEVLTLLGKPALKMVQNYSMPTVSIPNAPAVDLSKIMPYETWTYSKITQRFFTANSLLFGKTVTGSTSLAVMFDKDGIVQNYALTEIQ